MRNKNKWERQKKRQKYRTKNEKKNAERNEKKGRIGSRFIRTKDEERNRKWIESNGYTEYIKRKNNEDFIQKTKIKRKKQT